MRQRRNWPKVVDECVRRISILILPIFCTEAVEHDVCAENELVQMEPTATPTGAVPGLQMDHGEQELDREEQELDTEDQHSALTGLTGFLSGFAAAVQTTVSCPWKQ